MGNAARVALPKRKIQKQSTHKIFQLGDKVLKKVDNPISKISPRYEPGFIVVQVNPRKLTYVVRRQEPQSGQLSILKVHHNQLRFGSRGDPTPHETPNDRMATSVRTLNRLASLTQSLEEPP